MHYLKPNLSPKRKAQLRRRAGEYFAEQRLVEEALQQFIAADDVDSAAALFDANLHAIMEEE